MNLAEIRKKAQQEKDERQVALPVEKVSPAVEPMEKVSKPVEMHPDPIENTFHEPVIETCPQTVEAPLTLPVESHMHSPLVEEAAPSPYDPLAVLLQGRERAGCDEDAFLSPTLSMEVDDRDVQELLCFKVATEEYALNIMDIKEIIKPREVTEVPRVPSFVSGVLSLRGIIIPVFNMRVRLGLVGGTSSGKERIIVVKTGENGFCGILVDEVIQVVRIDSKDLEPPPTVLEGIDRDFVNGIGRFSGRMLILLNMEKILDVTLF